MNVLVVLLSYIPVLLHYPGWEHPLGAFHHRRSCLPPRGATHPPAPVFPIPSSSISILSCSAGSSSGTAKLLGHADSSTGTHPRTWGSSRRAPRPAARSAKPTVAVSVLPSASTGRDSAGQGLPGLAAEYEMSAVGIEVAAVDPPQPPRLLQLRMRPPSYLLRCRRWEQRKVVRRTDHHITGREGRGGEEEYDREGREETDDARLTGVDQRVRPCGCIPSLAKRNHGSKQTNGYTGKTKCEPHRRRSHWNWMAATS
ncbi:hypothetical protein PVAP13_2KG427705 [Panicum virgatum]|uniref:Uncharacterized protein n=1 Tax=Panicum virgatum TaxID=38727 RepID=A0A8T0WDS8_PANVG|nr:hypothetical protein PVAP13_2KG427705 [Panicum virgatum]